MEKIQILPITRRAAIIPKTLNKENRTVDVIFSTGAPVKRERFLEEPFIEELALGKKNVRLDRINNGAPFLNNHSANSIEDVLGVVEPGSVKVRPGQGTATVRFSSRDSVADVINDVNDGILRNISVGYRVFKFTEVGEQDGLKVLRAVDWEPIELSSVPAGADDGSKFRSEEWETLNDCIIERSITSTEEENGEEEPSQPMGNDPKPSLVRNEPENNHSMGEPMKENKTNVEAGRPEADIKAEGVRAERERQTSLRELCQKAKLGDEVEKRWLDSVITVEDARAEAIELFAKKDAAENVDSTSDATSVSVVREERDTALRGMENALLHQSSPAKYEVDDNGRRFAGLSMSDMARECLEYANISTRGMNKKSIMARALDGMPRGYARLGDLQRAGGLHTTSDFPLLLENIANKTLRDAYMAAPQTFMVITRRVTAPDFKTISRVQIGDAPDLELVGESGEVRRGTLGEAAEKYNVSTFGRIIPVSRQLLINDDLSSFSRMSELMGIAARDKESELIWGDFVSNPTMGDGNALFSAPHGNVGSAGVISDVTLGEFRELMRKQVGLNGRLINMSMSWLLVPAELETTAEKQTTAINPRAASDVNPFAPQGRTPLQIVVEPRLQSLPGGSATAYYGSANVGGIDIYELATLAGEQSPVIESREGFDVLGMEMKIIHDLGVKAIDHRGLVKNAG